MEIYTGEIYDYIHKDIKGKLVFDSGSNAGQMTERFIKKRCKVVAIEPQKELTTHPNYNGVYAIEHVCISDYIGEIDFYICGKHQSSSCFPDWGENRHPDQSIEKVTVPCVTLDFLIEKYDIPVYIKIDVEGNELNVFKGLSTKIDLISFEAVNGFLDKTNDCINLLNEKFGFKKLIAFMKKKIKKPGKKIIDLHAYMADITSEKDRDKFFNQELKKLIKIANRDVFDILVIS